MMSGDIAVPDSNNGTLLYSTLKECEANKWLELTRFGAGFDKARITEIGRNLVVKG